GSHSQAREKIVPYPRFISLLLEHMAPKYDNEELTINPTQVFSVHNWILKPNQPKEPPFTDYIKAIYNLDVHVDSKALKYSSPIKELEDLSDILKDTRSTFLTPDSPTDDLIIVSDVSKVEENAENDKDAKDTLVPPPSPKSAQLQELMAQVHLLQS
nr:hypothetical protein [Tanacetum cinerariifolium]